MTDNPGNYRVISDKSDMDHGFHYVACPLCLHEHAEAILTTGDHYNRLPGLFTMVRCRNCNFVYTNPRPFGATLASYYPDESNYYVPECDAENMRQQAASAAQLQKIRRYLGYTSANGAWQSRRFRYRFAADKCYCQGYPHWRPDGKVLEVGCSYGKFLFQLQTLGWRTTGLEMNAKAAQIARQELGLDVIVANLDDIELPPETYDCVILRMVLEHMPSPIDCLRKLQATIKPGGELIVIVPNYGCVESWFFGDDSFALILPQHMSHFTHDSINLALQRAGFVLDHIFNIKSSRDILQSIKIREQEKGANLLTRLIGSRGFRSMGVKLWLAFSKTFLTTSRMSVYAHKPLN